MTSWLGLSFYTLRINLNWQGRQKQKVLLPLSQMSLLCSWFTENPDEQMHIWKFLTGAMGASPEQPRMMEPDMTVAEKRKPAPGHAEFGVHLNPCHTNSRMLTTNAQIQRKVFRKLKNNEFLTKWAPWAKYLWIGHPERARSSWAMSGLTTLLWYKFSGSICFPKFSSKSRVIMFQISNPLLPMFLSFGWCSQHFPPPETSNDSNSFNTMTCSNFLRI